MGYGSGGNNYGSSDYGSSDYGSSDYGSNNNNQGDYNSYDHNSGNNGYGSDSGDDSGYYGGNNTPKKKKKNSGCIEGVITGYEVIPDNTGFLGAWFKSLFLGIPFTTKSSNHVFQLVEDEFNSDGMCTEVHMVGDIVAGRLNNGEKVTVYGLKSIGGPFRARKIVKSNSNMNVKLRNAMSALVVRIITLALIAAIVGIVIQFTGGSTSGGSAVVDGGSAVVDGGSAVVDGGSAVVDGGSAVVDGGSAVVDGGNASGSAANTNTGGGSVGWLFNAELWKQILAGVIVVLTLIFGGKIRNMTGLSMKVLWIIVAVLVGLLVPKIGASIIMICIILWAIKLMIKGFR